LVNISENFDPTPIFRALHARPYWATRLGKSRFIARRLLRDGGELHCELRGERMTIARYTVKFLKGEIVVPG
jgi:hypothetical protein